MRMGGLAAIRPVLERRLGLAQIHLRAAGRVRVELQRHRRVLPLAHELARGRGESMNRSWLSGCPFCVSWSCESW